MIFELCAPQNRIISEGFIQKFHKNISFHEDFSNVLAKIIKIKSNNKLFGIWLKTKCFDFIDFTNRSREPNLKCVDNVNITNLTSIIFEKNILGKIEQ